MHRVPLRKAVLRERQKYLAGLCLLALAGCARIPDTYAPPIQRKTPEEASAGLKHYIAMSMPDAPDHFVQDILPTVEAGGWRWAMQKPTLRFRVPTTRNLKLSVDLTVAEITFQQTGPVTISFFVNDHLLATERYEKFGEKKFEKPVPPEWISTEAPVLVRLEIDRMWVAPTDGVRRGFILNRIGFVQ